MLFGLRLPARLALWLSAALSWLLRIDPIFGMVRAGAGAGTGSAFVGALVGSGANGSCARDSDGCGEGGLLADVGVVLLMAGSCGPCSGMDACIGGGGAC